MGGTGGGEAPLVAIMLKPSLAIKTDLGSWIISQVIVSENLHQEQVDVGNECLASSMMNHP